MFPSNDHAVLIFVESIAIIDPVCPGDGAVPADVFRNGAAMAFLERSIQPIGCRLIDLFILFFLAFGLIGLRDFIKILISTVIAGMEKNLQKFRF